VAEDVRECKEESAVAEGGGFRVLAGGAVGLVWVSVGDLVWLCVLEGVSVVAVTGTAGF